MESIGTWWMWSGFFAIVLIMLAVDLFATGGGKSHRVSFREAAGWSAIWVGISLGFAAGLWFYLDGAMGREVANAKALEFLTGYLIEKSLAVDNVFVWLMLFSFFAIPLELQKRVLIYGVLGAIVLRTIMILVGGWLLQQFHWILYSFFWWPEAKRLPVFREELDAISQGLAPLLQRHIRGQQWKLFFSRGHIFRKRRDKIRWLKKLLSILDGRKP